MFTSHTKPGRLLLTVAATAIASHLSIAQAVPISSDISITGSSTYDTANSFSDPGASTSGTMTVTSGGTTTTTNYADGFVSSGANPLGGTLTDINDGFPTHQSLPIASSLECSSRSHTRRDPVFTRSPTPGQDPHARRLWFHTVCR